MKRVKVGLVGFGTIGTGVAKILLGKRDEIAQKTGVPLELVRIADKDQTTDRGITLPPGVLTGDVRDIVNDPTIDIAIELVGGLEPARTFVLEFLKSGKNVVTANKALLATHGPELFAEAKRQNRTIAFEAAVCGGIPILSSIATSLQANRIESINAIVNGTSNFILSRMEENGTGYSDAVAEAQRLGYAEANPAMDVNGTDAVQKLTILARLAFGASADWKKIPRIGIDIVDTKDIALAKRLSRRIRLLASARRTDGGVELKVVPTLVPESSPLAKVHEAFNAVEIIGDFVGSVFYQGLGAGERPTASAVCSDVIDTALGRTAITADALALGVDSRFVTPLVKPEETMGRAYLRIRVKDRPGVLAEIAGVLGKHGISIASMLQLEETETMNDAADLMILTHQAREGELASAVKMIDQFDFILEKTVRMGVRD